MALYTRPQVLVLVAVLATAGVGLAVGQWRRAYPELSERLERIEREVVDEASDASPPAVGTRDRGGAAPRIHGRIATARDGDEAARWRAAPRPDKRGSGPGGTGAEPPLDLNAAVLDDLVRLPGVGAVLAGRILEARDAERFSSIDDLRRVRGMGRAKIERLRPFLTVVADRGELPAPAGAPVIPAPDRAPPTDRTPPTEDREPAVDDG